MLLLKKRMKIWDAYLELISLIYVFWMLWMHEIAIVETGTQ